MKGLISKEEALELFPLILSGELLSIRTVREQLRELQTVEAVPLSVIERIHDTIDNADSDGFLINENGHMLAMTLAKEHVNEIIDKVVKEYTQEEVRECIDSGKIKCTVLKVLKEIKEEISNTTFFLTDDKALFNIQQIENIIEQKIEEYTNSLTTKEKK